MFEKTLKIELSPIPQAYHLKSFFLIIVNFEHISNKYAQILKYNINFILNFYKQQMHLNYDEIWRHCSISKNDNRE
jgi:hypothetical protein